MNIQLFILASILIEAVWESSKMVWQDGKISFDMVGTITVSMLVVFALSIDIFVLMNIDSNIPYLGMVLTGILIARGSNYIHDLIKKLQTKNLK